MMVIKLFVDDVNISKKKKKKKRDILLTAWTFQIQWWIGKQLYTITALERDQYEVLWNRVQQYWTRRMPSSILLYSAP
jgi:hypothetical protein